MFEGRRSAVSILSKAAESLKSEDRAALRDMLCELLDATDPEVRQEVLVSIYELLAPPGYADTTSSSGLDEWIESSDESVRRATARLAQQKVQFAATAKRLLAERGLTQEQLAQQLGVTQPTVSDLLAGKHKPQPKTLGRLADALGVAVDDLWPTR